MKNEWNKICALPFSWWKKACPSETFCAFFSIIFYCSVLLLLSEKKESFCGVLLDMNRNHSKDNTNVLKIISSRRSSALLYFLSYNSSLSAISLAFTVQHVVMWGANEAWGNVLVIVQSGSVFPKLDKTRSYDQIGRFRCNWFLLIGVE